MTFNIKFENNNRKKMNKLIYLSIFMCMLFPTNGDESKFKILRIDATESMKTHAFGTALIALESSTDPNTVATKLANEFNNVYGRHWFCLVGPEGSMSHFDAVENTLIWFAYDNLQIILFKPIQLSKSDILVEAKKQTNVTVVKTEMAELMKETALLVTTLAIKSYDTFQNISTNITTTFNTLYGQYWQCYLSGKGSEANVNYIAGNYINFIVDELEIYLYRTSQPQFLQDQSSIIERTRASTVVNVDSLNAVDNATRDGILAIAKDAIKASASYTAIANAVRTNTAAKYGAGVWAVLVTTWPHSSESWNIAVKRQINFHIGEIRFVILQIS